MNWKKTLIICCIILLSGGAVTALIFFTEPTARRSGATKETAMLVDVTTVQQDTFRPTIEVMGSVEPEKDIILSPQVTGKVIDRADSFTPGGYVEEGDTLLQIDPSDYRNTLRQRKSELQQAKADLKIERGRQEVALEEYQLIGDTLAGMNKSLVLREPQLESVQSEVASARAAVEQAELELQRTTITAPFNAHILSRNVNIGSQVAPGDNLGRLVGRDTYWVEATVPLSKIRWLTFPGDQKEKGSKVSIRNRTAWEKGAYRTGYLHKMVGTLEEETRMARILITVPDPLAYRPENRNRPSLMIGAFVEASIQTNPLSDVVRVNRDYIRKNETVWVMEEGKLRIREVDIRFRDEKNAYITEGLKDKDQVVTTNLSTVNEGAKLRLGKYNQPTQQDTL